MSAEIGALCHLIRQPSLCVIFFSKFATFIDLCVNLPFLCLKSCLSITFLRYQVNPLPELMCKSSNLKMVNLSSKYLSCFCVNVYFLITLSKLPRKFVVNNFRSLLVWSIYWSSFAPKAVTVSVPG